jgi:hypothetical protein
MVWKLITANMDFLILTKWKAHPTALARSKLQHGMIISHHSSHQQARKGAIIIVKPEHTIMEGSLRKSLEPGLISATVYEVNKSRTVVIDVYGVFENNDHSSVDLKQEVSNIERELKHLYDTQHVLRASDFNVVLQPTRMTITSGKPEHQENQNIRKTSL